MNRRWIVTIVFLLTLTGLFIWMGGRQVVTIAHIALADEQTAIFEDMVNQASKVLSDSPPNVRQAVEYLQYAHHYYPSGTKQTTGTRLDRIVERCRNSSEQRIIELLRRAGAKDCGTDPEDWIKEHLPRSNVRSD
jgi:hypothetical protein